MKVSDKSKQENIHAGHRQRMLEHFRSHGLDSFHPHEVVELLLFSSIRRANTNPLGHMLINKFGSLKNVLEAKPDELTKVAGIGKASAENLCSIRKNVSAIIRSQFSDVETLDRYNLAFLAYWYMRDESRPLGIMLCTLDGRLYDFYCIPLIRGKDGLPNMNAMLSEIGDEIPEGSCSIFMCNADTFSEDDIYEIRRYMFGISLVLDEIYWLRRHEPIPLLHPTTE